MHIDVKHLKARCASIGVDFNLLLSKCALMRTLHITKQELDACLSDGFLNHYRNEIQKCRNTLQDKIKQEAVRRSTCLGKMITDKHWSWGRFVDEVTELMFSKGTWDMGAIQQLSSEIKK